MLEHADEVRERLVECQHVNLCGNCEFCAHAVEQRVRQFVDDDIMREARIHALALHETVSRFFSREPTEIERPLDFVVVRVALLVRAGMQDQCPWIDISVALVAIEAPNGIPAEGCLESRVDGAAHRVNHLILELAIGTRRCVALRQQNPGVIEVATRVAFGPFPAVGLLNMEQPPARSALERFEWHVDEGHGAVKFRHSRIEGKNPQGPVDGIARASLVRAHVYVA